MKLLLNTEKVDVDSKDFHSRTPLSWAARNGHREILKLLLDTEKVDLDWKNSQTRSLVVVNWWAIGDVSWTMENG